ncbi:MAG: right-handed parallel beta-helix repeat-containing protein, partial [bacterium]|nr:right-handed parallel beta-helix repeat-containing protein [bacterium]
MRIIYYILLIIVLLASTGSTGNAEIPKTIHYQGRVVTNTGSIIDGTVTAVFSIWNADIGGSMLWDESQPIRCSQEGLFSVLLGKQTPLNLPFDTSYWIETKIVDQVLRPRLPFGAAAYAFYSINADTVDGKHATDLMGAHYQQAVTVAKSGGDYTSISSALAAISPSADNPYLVMVMPGVYEEAVQLKSFVELRGSGRNSCKIISSSGTPLTVPDGVESVSIERFTIDAGKLYGLVCSGNSCPMINDCRLIALADHTVAAALCNDNSAPWITNCELLAKNSGIKCDDSASPMVNNSQVKGDKAVWINNSLASPKINYSQIIGSIYNPGNSIRYQINNCFDMEGKLIGVTQAITAGTATYALNADMVDGKHASDLAKVHYDHVLIVSKTGGDYGTISEAMASIEPSLFNRYLVLVMPGTYEESITLKPFVDIKGSGRDSCRILCGLSHTVKADTDIGSASISGFTIEATGPGNMGVYLTSGSPIITNCLIKSHESAVLCEGAAKPLIQDCVLEGYQHGLTLSGSCEPVVIGCLIKGDIQHGLNCETIGRTQIRDCIIEGQRYGAYLYRSSPIITNCKIKGIENHGVCCYKADADIANSQIETDGVSKSAVYINESDADAILRIYHCHLRSTGGVSSVDAQIDGSPIYVNFCSMNAKLSPKLQNQIKQPKDEGIASYALDADKLDGYEPMELEVGTASYAGTAGYAYDADKLDGKQPMELEVGTASYAGTSSYAYDADKLDGKQPMELVVGTASYAGTSSYAYDADK